SGEDPHWGQTPSHRLPGGRSQARALHGVSGHLADRRRAGEEQPVPGGFFGSNATLLEEEEVGSPSPQRVRSRFRALPRRSGRSTNAGGAPAVRSGQSPGRRSEGVALGRAHDGARPRRSRSPAPDDSR